MNSVKFPQQMKSQGNPSGTNFLHAIKSLGHYSRVKQKSKKYKHIIENLYNSVNGDCNRISV